MAGLTGADFFVSRIGIGATDVAAFDFAYAHNVSKHRFRAPETSARYDCLLACCHEPILLASPTDRNSGHVCHRDALG